MLPEAIENGHHHDHITVPSRFLFINRNLSSKSLSKSETPTLSPIINRHVQRWSWETKRQKKQASAQNPVRRRLDQKREPSAVCTDVSRKGGLQKAKLGFVQPKAPRSNLNEHQSAAEEPKLKACIWSDGNYLDPFASTDINVDAGVYWMLQYFTFTWKPFPCSCDVKTHLCMFPCETDASNSNQQSSPSGKEIVQNCLKNKTHMYALLASCAGRMKNVSQHELASIAKPESYMAKAIHALREHLIKAPEVDKDVIRDVFFMFTCEYFSQNIDSAESYLRILRSMVDRIGGFSCIDIYDRRLYWCGDIGLALETGRPPILPALDDSRIYYTYHFSDLSIQKTGRAFQRDDSGIVSPLDDIITDIVLCTQSIQCIIAARLKIDKQRMFEHGADFLHRLLCLREPQDSCCLSELREECCRQALLLWIFNVMIWTDDTVVRTSQPNPRLARPLIAGRLKKAIRRVDSFGRSCWDSHLELLIWMVSLGSCVVTSGEDQGWFTDRFIQLAGLLQIRHVEQMSDLFGQYLHLDTFERADLIWLAGLLVQKRDNQTESPR